MILGLTHAGLTVKELNRSIEFYREILGSRVVSDAERKGEVADKITGIPGMHTRTVYVSITPYEHLELFQFHNPKTFSDETEPHLQVGILYYAIMKENMVNLLEIEGPPKNDRWPELIKEYKEEPQCGFRAITLQDPDGLLFRIIESRTGETGDQKAVGNRLLYPALVVAQLETALEFYQDLLGLEIASQGVYSPDEEAIQHGKMRGPIRWALLKAPAGVCLKLIQPLYCKVLPAPPWRMEKVGFTHMAFAVKNLEIYYQDLLERGVDFIASPQTLRVGPHEDGGCVYLRTPDGITIEFIDSPLIHEQIAQVKTVDRET